MNWPDDFMNKIICGDCLEMMREFPNESIDMCLTSPPYWGLRDYGLGPNQLGLEPTPEMYIEHLAEIFNEVKRVLKKEGTLWLNIGDTYNNSPSNSGNLGNRKALDKIGRQNRELKTLPPKCLLMIPERLAWSLIQNGWILRNKIIWHKTNGMPSSVKDRFTNKYEFIYLFSKSRKYYFDLDAVREEHAEVSLKRAMPHRANVIGNKGHPAGSQEIENEQFCHPQGKNPGDVWTIPTAPCPVKGIHFATFPEELCRRAIKTGCPEQICKKCGKAKERILKNKSGFDENDKCLQCGESKNKHIVSKNSSMVNFGKDERTGKPIPCGFYKTIGWTSCDCGVGFTGGIILDPFCGIGTACYVARKLGRRYIGIDIKPEYCEKAENIRLAQGVL